MTINTTLGEYGAQQLEISGKEALLRGIDIWNVESDTPIVRNLPLFTGELDNWLDQSGDFALPDSVRTAKVIGSLRLLCQCWSPDSDVPGPNEVKLTQLNWQSVVEKLNLPLSYTFDLVNGKDIPIRTVLRNKDSRHRISRLPIVLQYLERDAEIRILGSICQSAPLEDSFMTLALTFDPANRCTTGFYGFNIRPNYNTPGLELLDRIQQESDQIEDPMLIPALFYGTWIDAIQLEHSSISLELRKVQEQTGLMSDYLRQHRIVEDVMNFDSVHRTLVLQHAYLTNGSSEFVRRLGPATMNAVDRIEEYYENHQSIGYKYDSTEVREYVEHMQVRASTEMQHRQRMLDRISMYLQVLYNLMQQQIARETKRDSSAMKSIALLTMIFLPATAIATIVSPFINISEEDKVSLNFKLFWAIAGPITLCVVLTWGIWTERVQMRKLLEHMKKPT